jgi:hypothetical protein
MHYLWNNGGERTNEMSFPSENGHDCPWKTIIEDEKVIAFSCKIVEFRDDSGLLPLYPSGTILGAAPKQGLLCGGPVTKNSKKTICPPCF